MQDISFKVQRQQNVIQRTSITQDFPWKIQQVQDAANHLQQAINHIDNVDSNYNFQSSEEVLHILSNILGALQRGRTSLVVPKKKPIDELMKSRNMKSLTPNLPEDLALSFYIQSHKLIFATYQLTNNQGTMKFESTQAECSVPWLNEVLVLFTVALTLCQQLKDKVSFFSFKEHDAQSMKLFLNENLAHSITDFCVFSVQRLHSWKQHGSTTFILITCNNNHRRHRCCCYCCLSSFSVTFSSHR